MPAFFFASAGASSAYLTVSEIFPMETRALSIAFFYAAGTAVGGIVGPLLFGHMIETGDAMNVFWAYALGAALMIAGGIAEILLGVSAEQEQLEDIAKPLTAREAEEAEEEAPPAERERPRLSGRERFRLGPGEGQASWSPVMSASTRSASDRDVEREVASLVEALQRSGEANRRQLYEDSGARHWGPGRFRRALARALREGRIRIVGRPRYGASRET
jgi:hypothetical protein